MKKQSIAIFGGGPSGLMAAETLSGLGHAVTLYEAMPTVGRKFLLAGKSGLNLTHGEDFDRFRNRFGAASARLAAALDAFPPDALRKWADGLGAETFTGTSGRVFPRAMKASPLLRQWLQRLKAQGVTIHVRHKWLGPDGTRHRVETPEGIIHVQTDAALLAFGGGSWPRLGSDGGWVEPLARQGLSISPLVPANCGFDRSWSPYVAEHFAGAPVKSVVATSAAGSIQGEFVISSTGIEGSLIYAHAAALREEIAESGRATLTLDLAPGRSIDRLASELASQKAKLSFSNRLRKGGGLDAAKVALLRECHPACQTATQMELAALIKALPLVLERPRPLTEAISSAGGIRWEEIDGNYMLATRPGLFVAGEMIDWEAPTGGYLLTACLATGRAAAIGIAAFLS